MVTLWERYGQKLRRVILHHFGLVTFRVAYGRDRKHRFSLFLDFWDPVILIGGFGYTKFIKKSKTNPGNHFRKYYV